MSGTIKILTNDGNEHEVDAKAAMMNESIKNLIEDLGDSDCPIPIPNVDSKTFEKVMEFCMYYRDRPLVDGKFEQDKEWDDAFLDYSDESFSHGDFLQLLLAANYAENKPLLGACCDRVAAAIGDKDVSEIRDMVGVCNVCHTEDEKDEKEEEDEEEEESTINMHQILAVAQSVESGGDDTSHLETARRLADPPMKTTNKGDPTLCKHGKKRIGYSAEKDKKLQSIKTYEEWENYAKTL